MAAKAADTKAGPRDAQRLAGLRAWLFTAQDGRCFDCGEPMRGYEDADGVNLCHLVGGFERGYGYLEGNTPLGHRACNVAQDRAFGKVGNVIPWGYLAKRADRIPATYPDRRTLVRIGREATADREAAINARVERMLAESE